MGYSEPGGGSDVASITTTARYIRIQSWASVIYIFLRGHIVLADSPQFFFDLFSRVLVVRVTVHFFLQTRQKYSSVTTFFNAATHRPSLLPPLLLAVSLHPSFITKMKIHSFYHA